MMRENQSSKNSKPVKLKLSSALDSLSLFLQWQQLLLRLPWRSINALIENRSSRPLGIWAPPHKAFDVVRACSAIKLDSYFPERLKPMTNTEKMMRYIRYSLNRSVEEEEERVNDVNGGRDGEDEVEFDLGAPLPFKLADVKTAIPKHCWVRDPWRSMNLLNNKQPWPPP
ncbi:hypothetical protein C1H46_010187 [Malus baccata]|uniref:Fatty acid desaturase N-terminal domain-containing protein n=1 Tax=Malus baccata TaxID=106549 RepID=A0A540N0Z4_MALBA|nr:hypothetical protein C1H46_010187 [Malus baccata]